MSAAVVGGGSCLEVDDDDSCWALSLEEPEVTEMLDEDDDVDKPYLPPLVPFAVTFVAAPPPVPVLLYADDETDLQSSSNVNIANVVSFGWARGQGLHLPPPSLTPSSLYFRVMQSS